MIYQPKVFLFKKKTDWFLTAFILIWTTSLVISILTVLYGFYQHPDRISDLFFILLMMIFVAFLAVNYLTWQIKGREQITFYPEYIEFKRLGTSFTNKTIVKYYEMDDFVLDIQKSLFGTFWGLGSGKIKINYLGRNKRFGQSLTIEEAENYIALLKIELSKRQGLELNQSNISAVKFHLINHLK